MELEKLREELKNLEQQREKIGNDLKSIDAQRARIVDGMRQLDGAIGFCKGLIEKAEKGSEPKTGE